MKTKLTICALIVLAFTGCSTTTRSQMDVVDLNYYRINCDQKEEQLEWLRSQMPTQHEKLMNGLSMTSMLGWVNSSQSGNFKEDRAMFNGEQAAIASSLIRKLEDQCRYTKPKQREQGCVAVNENTAAGASAGSQCYQNGKKPVSRWEAMVDN